MTEPSYTIAVAKSTHTSEDGWCGDPDSGPGADAGPGQLRPLLPPSARHQQAAGPVRRSRIQLPPRRGRAPGLPPAVRLRQGGPELWRQIILITLATGGVTTGATFPALTRPPTRTRPTATSTPVTSAPPSGEVAHMINISKYNMERYRRYLHVYLYRHEGAGSHWTTGRVSTISTCPQQAPVTELETLENFFRASLLRVWFW